MKTTKLYKLACVALCSTAFSLSAQAEEKIASSADGKIYFGIEGGYSFPAKTKFKDKTASGAQVTGKLKGTGVYEGKIGYRFYPNMAVELAYAYRPAYKLGVYPADTSTKVLNIPINITNILSKTKVQSHTLMLNLIYEAQTEKAYRPYFLAGVGYAHVTPKQSPMSATISVPQNVQAIAQATLASPQGAAALATLPAQAQAAVNGLAHGATVPLQVGKITKFTSERLGWRIGTGIVYDINDHCSLIGGVKLEVINKIALHTSNISPIDGTLLSKDSVKKTIGVLDFTVGLRYTL
jgi:opacity protein-like surface antigen